MTEGYGVQSHLLVPVMDVMIYLGLSLCSQVLISLGTTRGQLCQKKQQAATNKMSIDNLCIASFYDLNTIIVKTVTDLNIKVKLLTSRWRYHQTLKILSRHGLNVILTLSIAKIQPYFLFCFQIQQSCITGKSLKYSHCYNNQDTHESYPDQMKGQKLNFKSKTGNTADL